MAKDAFEIIGLLKILKLGKLADPDSPSNFDWVFFAIMSGMGIIIGLILGFRRGMNVSDSDLSVETRWYKWVFRTRRIPLNSIADIGQMKFVENPPWFIEIVRTKDKVWLPHDPRGKDLEELMAVEKIKAYLGKI